MVGTVCAVMNANWLTAVFGACMELYDNFRSEEDADFKSFISQPFLTSAEQDDLIAQLRDNRCVCDCSFFLVPNSLHFRYFDLFTYSAQQGAWCCAKCGRIEKNAREGVPVGNAGACVFFCFVMFFTLNDCEFFTTLQANKKQMYRQPSQLM